MDQTKTKSQSVVKTVQFKSAQVGEALASNRNSSKQERVDFARQLVDESSKRVQQVLTARRVLAG